MRRSLGGLILLVSGGFFALAISSFWLERVSFSPEINTDSAYAILGDEDIQRQIASVVAGADAQELGLSPADLQVLVTQVTRIREGATEMRVFTAAAHDKLIGGTEEPVVITPSEQVQITRTERAAVLPAITLPVQRVAAFDVLASITRWTTLVSLGLALLTLLLGVILRPERGEFMFALGTGLMATGVGLILFGYLIPTFVFPLISDDIWVGLFPSLATHRVTLTLAGGLGSIVLGAAVILFTGGRRQRRQRSTPLAATRYREQRSWSN
ncbi:hypothetical protein [Ilumatobacter nonamiensis]|uniref:hypothetical protein n=1 Tax=Ilumatobacter nonamiensis TaxID=467093 RepID=UPI00034603E2|nr:hypothetical protein [Ilumatobacter nonamiensis]